MLINCKNSSCCSTPNFVLWQQFSGIIYTQHKQFSVCVFCIFPSTLESIMIIKFQGNSGVFSRLCRSVCRSSAVISSSMKEYYCISVQFQQAFHSICHLYYCFVLCSQKHTQWLHNNCFWHENIMKRAATFLADSITTEAREL